MSYSLETPCINCDKGDKCTDQASIAGAISGIHQMPYGVGHLGAGIIKLECSNVQKKQPK